MIVQHCIEELRDAMAKMYFDIVLHYTLQVMKLLVQNPHPPQKPITHRLLGAQHRSHFLGPVLHGLSGTGCVCSDTDPAMGIPCWLPFAGEVFSVVGNRENVGRWEFLLADNTFSLSR